MLLYTVMKRVHQAAATTHSPLSPVKTIGPLPDVKTTNENMFQKLSNYQSPSQEANITSMPRLPRSTNFFSLTMNP